MLQFPLQHEPRNLNLHLVLIVLLRKHNTSDSYIPIIMLHLTGARPRPSRHLVLLFAFLIFLFPCFTYSSPAPNTAAVARESSVSATKSSPSPQSTGPGAILPNTEEFMLNKTIESTLHRHPRNHTDRPPPARIDKSNVKLNRLDVNNTSSSTTRTVLPFNSKVLGGPISFSTTFPTSTLLPTNLPQAFNDDDPDVTLPTVIPGADLLPCHLDADWSVNNNTLESVMLHRRGPCPCPSSQRTCAYSNPSANQCYCCNWDQVCS